MNKYITGFAALLMVSCGSKDNEYDASGVFEATEVVVSAMAQGQILNLGIEEGDNVTAGQVVGNINDTQLMLQKQQLSANKKVNTSHRLDVSNQVSQLQNSLATQQKQIAVQQQQLQNLQKERTRFANLLAHKAATQKQVADIDYQISVVQKQIAAAEQQIGVTQSQISAQREQLNANNAALEGQNDVLATQMSTVDEKIGDATIKSPITGVVLQKYAEAGEYAAPGKALFKVADIKDMKLRAYITADQLNSIKIGQKVTVYADEGTEDRKAYEGHVTWISSKAEFTPKTIMTRDERANLVYAIKISVDNKQGLIKSGMYGEVAFGK